MSPTKANALKSCSVFLWPAISAFKMLVMCFACGVSYAVTASVVPTGHGGIHVNTKPCQLDGASWPQLEGLDERETQV